MTESPSGAAGPVVLVTGGAGYIGSHACEALAREGFGPSSTTTSTAATASW